MSPFMLDWSTDPAVKQSIMARERRQAWAQSKDSLGQRSKLELNDRQKAPHIEKNGRTETPAEQPGQTWLSCRSSVELRKIEQIGILLGLSSSKQRTESVFPIFISV